MKPTRPSFRAAARWSVPLALAAALGVLAAAACGPTDDAAEPSPPQEAAGTTETSGSDATTATTDAAPEPSVEVGHAVGMMAPDFTAETVAGDSITLSEVSAGSPVLLYFFTTW